MMTSLGWTFHWAGRFIIGMDEWVDEGWDGGGSWCWSVCVWEGVVRGKGVTSSHLLGADGGQRVEGVKEM